MRTLVSGIVAAIVVAIVAGVAFSLAREPVYAVYSSSSTRIGEPGSNLVGHKWSGNPASGRDASTESAAGAAN
jgi:hypothetical protein